MMMLMLERGQLVRGLIRLFGKKKKSLVCGDFKANIGEIINHVSLISTEKINAVRSFNAGKVPLFHPVRLYCMYMIFTLK